MNLKGQKLMRVKKIKNKSNEDVQLNVGDGSKLTLSPGSSFNNLRVENLDQIRSKVEITSDLGEICETNSGPVKLYD